MLFVVGASGTCAMMVITRMMGLVGLAVVTGLGSVQAFMLPTHHTPAYRCVLISNDL